MTGLSKVASPQVGLREGAPHVHLGDIFDVNRLDDLPINLVPLIDSLSSV